MVRIAYGDDSEIGAIVDCGCTHLFVMVMLMVMIVIIVLLLIELHLFCGG